MMRSPTSTPSIVYSTVTGYFMQDDPSTNPEDFDYVRDITELELDIFP